MIKHEELMRMFLATKPPTTPEIGETEREWVKNKVMLEVLTDIRDQLVLLVAKETKE